MAIRPEDAAREAAEFAGRGLYQIGRGLNTVGVTAANLVRGAAAAVQAPIIGASEGLVSGLTGQNVRMPDTAAGGAASSPAAAPTPTPAPAASPAATTTPGSVAPATGPARFRSGGAELTTDSAAALKKEMLAKGAWNQWDAPAAQLRSRFDRPVWKDDAAYNKAAEAAIAGTPGAIVLPRRTGGPNPIEADIMRREEAYLASGLDAVTARDRAEAEAYARMGTTGDRVVARQDLNRLDRLRTADLAAGLERDKLAISGRLATAEETKAQAALKAAGVKESKSDKWTHTKRTEVNPANPLVPTNLYDVTDEQGRPLFSYNPNDPLEVAAAQLFAQAQDRGLSIPFASLLAEVKTRAAKKQETPAAQ